MTKSFNLIKTAATFLFAFSCGITICTTSLAQTPDNINPMVAPEPTSGNTNDSLNVVDNSLDNSIDLLVTTNDVTDEAPLYPIFPDSVYDSRIHSLPTCLPLTYNDEVRKFIDLYTLRRRNQVERMVGLSKIYFPVFDQIMTENQVPTDLKYLSIIESALNPHAVSRCGATGMWQFMYSTGKLYGLKINGYMDERKDIIKSTEAAATYLKNMYNTYGDWLLSIAAYNCGAGNVNRAILRSGGSYDFWTISKYLPKETRSYVPAFIAAMYVMNYYDTHEIYPQYPEFNICDICTVDIFDKISFEQLSKYTDISVDEIKFLNPALRSDVIPVFGSEPYSLKLPTEKLLLFEEMKDSIIFSSRNYSAKYYSSYKGHYYENGKGNFHTYTVKSGESLAIVAQKNKCTVSQLKSWNAMKGTMVHPGQKLKIYGSSGYSTNTTTQSNTTTKKTTSTPGKVVYYKVRSGDTLWGISNKYPGVTVADIKASNSPSKVNNLQPGMVLKINL